MLDRRADGGLRVLLVRRPKYDDWSFPKGGAHEGETLEQTALREVEEETGIGCRIVRRIPSTRYSYRTREGALRPKVVHYFLMEPSSFEIEVDGDEVDRAEWLDPESAHQRLSYRYDRELLDALLSE